MRNATERQEIIDRIASVVNEPGEERPAGPYATASEWEMRQLYAESWVNVGFTDPQNVAAWIEEGVFNAGVAYEAVRAGYRPSDPWVERSHASFTMPQNEPLQAPSTFAAFRNRARARRAWKIEYAERQRVERDAQRKMAQLAAVTRSLGYDDGFGAVTLDLLSATSVAVLEEDVVRAFNELSTTLQRLHSRLDELPGLIGDERTTTRNELRYWNEIAGTIAGQLGACSAEVRASIEGELAPEREWLAGMHRHYQG